MPPISLKSVKKVGYALDMAPVYHRAETQKYIFPCGVCRTHCDLIIVPVVFRPQGEVMSPLETDTS